MNGKVMKEMNGKMPDSLKRVGNMGKGHMVKKTLTKTQMKGKVAKAASKVFKNYSK